MFKYLYIKVNWNDPRLTWTPASYNNIEQVIIPASKLWLPDLVVINSVDTNIFLLGSLLSNINVIVDYKGWVNLIYTTTNLKTRCQMVTILIHSLFVKKKLVIKSN